MTRPPLDEFTSTTTLKFLCSYDGKILPRYLDGKLRYHGGHTRVLAVPRSISFHELLIKMGELCNNSSITLRCQLPTEDLDALITIKSDEDLANLIEEYNRLTQNSSVKIRAFLLPHKPAKQSPASPSRSESPKTLSPNSLSPSSSFNFSGGGFSPRFNPPPAPILSYPINYSRNKSQNQSQSQSQSQNQHRKIGCRHCCRNSSRVYVVHNGIPWQ